MAVSFTPVKSVVPLLIRRLIGHKMKQEEADLV